MPWSQKARHPRSKVWGGDGLRGHVAGVPVVLVAGVENAAEVGLDMRADQSCPVHDLSDFLQSLADFDTVERGINGGEGAQDFFDGQAFLEWEVAFGVECFRGGHPASHPQENAAVSRGGGMLNGLVSPQAWRGGHQRG